MKNLLFYIFILSVTTLTAQESDIEIFKIRAAGMGNAVLACDHMSDGYYFNPAALFLQNDITFTLLINGTMYLNPGSVDFFNFSSSYRGELIRNFDGSVENDDYNLKFQKYSQKYYYRGFNNFSIEYIKKGFGFSISSVYRQAYKLNKLNDKANITFQDNFNIVSYIGYSVAVPYYKNKSNLSIGFALESHFSKINDNISIHNRDKFDLFYSAFNFRNIFKQYPEIFNLGKWQNGYYLDVGFLYQIKKYHVNIAAVLKNVLGKKETSQAYRFGDIGIAYYPGIFQNRKFIKHFVLSWNLVNIGRNEPSFNNSNIIGTEIRLPLFDLRAGMHR